jgi:hypothetical protein
VAKTRKMTCWLKKSGKLQDDVDRERRILTRWSWGWRGRLWQLVL